MNTLMIEIGEFNSFDPKSNSAIMVVARDDFAETTLTYDSVAQACEKLPTREALVAAVLENDGFDDLVFSEDSTEDNPDIEDYGLFILGFEGLHQLNE